jgi:hypothetical protein
MQVRCFDLLHESVNFPMIAVGPRFEPMTTGILLDRALQLYSANFSLMLGITAVAYVPFCLIMLAIESALDINAESSDALTLGFYALFYIVTWSSVGYPIAGGAATYAISERYLGNDVTIAAALRRSLSAFWQLSLASLAATTRMLFGFVLLIVPGVLWTLSYSLIVPAILVEGLKAAPSLARSRELIDGHRGKAACIIVLSLTLQLVISIGLSMSADWLVPAEAGEKTLLSSALDGLLAILFIPFFEIATILLYYDMRMRKEGFDLDMLSRAFAPQQKSLIGAPVAGD